MGVRGLVGPTNRLLLLGDCLNIFYSFSKPLCEFLSCLNPDVNQERIPCLYNQFSLLLDYLTSEVQALQMIGGEEEEIEDEDLVR